MTSGSAGHIFDYIKIGPFLVTGIAMGITEDSMASAGVKRTPEIRFPTHSLRDRLFSTRAVRPTSDPLSRTSDRPQYAVSTPLTAHTLLKRSVLESY